MRWRTDLAKNTGEIEVVEAREANVLGLHGRRVVLIPQDSDGYTTVHPGCVQPTVPAFLRGTRRGFATRIDSPQLGEAPIVREPASVSRMTDDGSRRWTVPTQSTFVFSGGFWVLCVSDASGDDEFGECASTRGGAGLMRWPLV